MEVSKTIYEQLGDEQLQLLIDTFYPKVFSSPIIGSLFNKTDQQVIKDKQFCFLTQFLGGPPRYNHKYGAPKMRLRHIPHPIDEKAKEEWLKLMKESIQVLAISDHLKEVLYNCFPNVAAFMVNR